MGNEQSSTPPPMSSDVIEVETAAPVNLHPAILEGKNPICSLTPIEGECRAAHSRFFYDPDVNTCVHFTYGGCGGNDNSFEGMDECFDVCGDKNTQVGDISALGYQYYGYSWESNPDAIRMMNNMKGMYQKYLDDNCPGTPSGCGSREWPEEYVEYDEDEDYDEDYDEEEDEESDEYLDSMFNGSDGGNDDDDNDDGDDSYGAEQDFSYLDDF